MINTCLKTFSGARLQLVYSGRENLHWLFLPGGPGLGSESLTLLMDSLKLPGSMWRLDLPGDGSNTSLNNYESFSHWPIALIEAIGEFKHVILVAHSTGGMYALSTPEIEELLSGLILLNSAPNATWQDSFEINLKHFPIQELETLQEAYKKHPSNDILKLLTIASAPYLFTKKGLALGIKMLNSLPYNYETCEWSKEHFDHNYKAKWAPKSIPTLILSGEHDLITPLKAFLEEENFNHKNITFKLIKNSGHFPWIENPKDVIAAFEEYCARQDFPSIK